MDEAEAIGSGHKLEGLFDAAALPHQLSSISTCLTQLLSGLDDIGGRRPSSQSAVWAEQQRATLQQAAALCDAAMAPRREIEVASQSTWSSLRELLDEAPLAEVEHALKGSSLSGEHD